MKKMRRIMLWLFGAMGLVFVMAACGWIYATSNVATPSYQVSRTDGAIEIREYPELIMAEITTRGTRGEAVRAGFSPLAGYIFAKEREGEKIAMTAPVNQRATNDGEWSVQFIMPEEYTLETLPRPTNADVRLVTEPPVRRAAIRFSGSWSDKAFAEQETALRDWLSTEGLTTTGAPLYAYYNDPFTPPFMRRNEVIVDLVAN